MQLWSVFAFSTYNFTKYHLSPAQRNGKQVFLRASMCIFCVNRLTSARQICAMPSEMSRIMLCVRVFF